MWAKQELKFTLVLQAKTDVLVCQPLLRLFATHGVILEAEDGGLFVYRDKGPIRSPFFHLCQPGEASLLQLHNGQDVECSVELAFHPETDYVHSLGDGRDYDHVPAGKYRVLVHMTVFFYMPGDNAESPVRNEEWLVRCGATVDVPEETKVSG